MTKILVTGGAGYIGSHMVDLLGQHGYQVVVFDNLSTGSKEAVNNAELMVGDLSDHKALASCFAAHEFTAVMHFAAAIVVNESVINPQKYYQNNLVGSINLLDAMKKFNVKKLIFSSSAAVYGSPQYVPVDIDHPKNPLNSYGRSKWLFEEILKDYQTAYQLKHVSLRYFNASGADPAGRFGPRCNDATHLIPLVLQVASGRRKAIEVFGFDYPTRDGTCIRDYIHVADLCSAHLLALKALVQSESPRLPHAVYNLGNGRGYSVLEVIKTAEEVTGKHLPIIKSGRRAGDPAELVADASLAQQELTWNPAYPELATIIEHNWRWERARK